MGGRQAQAVVDWDKLVAGLSKPLRQRFDRILRRSLRQRLAKVEELDTSLAPDSVRSQAICEWRKRYMKGASKSAKKRMNYAHLHTDPTYLAIEKELAKQYWQKSSNRIDQPSDEESSSTQVLPRPSDVASLTLSEACEAYRATKPRLGGSSLDAFLREVITQAYKDRKPREAVLQRMTADVCDIVRNEDLSSFARMSTDSGSHQRRMRNASQTTVFGLQETTTKDEVAALVRSSRLIDHIVRRGRGAMDPYVLARDRMVRRVRRHPHVVATNALVGALVGEGDPATPVLQRMAKPDAKSVDDYLRSDEFCSVVVDELLNNPIYGAQHKRSVELRLRVRENVPQTPMEAYPLARTMRRHITLHVGPTNSGKTHDALRALAAADSGTYLGPLRLLAYEQFEELNRMGCTCSLLTGEEAIEVAGARHVSSTVEMANFHVPIDVAVIDEAQMIADKDRGHHWTEALLGIPAWEVHVCCAPHAESVVCRLVELCEDRITIVRHERLVPLRPTRRSFRVPENVMPGDALVVFSRKSVHNVASTLATCGIRASLVYGALPHDVRHEEARRFDEGETDVVVATDAIGMGMNLPIRRVVFVEQEKFDGRTARPLRPEEIQQIAGRAGRFGRYDEGWYTSTRQLDSIKKRYDKPVPSIDSIPVGIPADIALVRDATLSDCLRQWMALEQPEPFHRVGIARDLALITKVESRLDEERRTNIDDKLLALSLATMAFDERDRELYRTWLRMVDAELTGEEFLFEIPAEPSPNTKLIELEVQYRYCDLLYTYARTFEHPDQLELLTQRRNQISHVMMRVLAAG